MTTKSFRRLTWQIWEKAGSQLTAVVKKIARHDKVPILMVLGAAFAVRVVNLDYNSPFNDEAIYIVVGRMGIFEWDWWSYNARSWMAGQIYVFPVMTALAYVSGGIIGSRFLSVLFGLVTIEAVMVLAMRLTENKKTAGLAGLTAGVLFAFLPVSIFVSRLATYDISSYAGFFVGLVVLIQAIQSKARSGSLYFLAAASFLFSFMAKVVTLVYLPLILIGSYLATRRNPEAFRFWQKYFLVPLYAALAVYGLISVEPLITYARNQLETEKASLADIVKAGWQQVGVEVIPLAVGIVGLAVKKRWPIIVVTMAGMIGILIPHLIFGKLATLDKHLVVIGGFGAVAAGVGIAGLVEHLRGKVKLWIYSGLTIAGIVYSLSGIIRAADFNRRWPDAGAALAYLVENVQSGDRVLTETGAAAILATYERNYPLNTTTFDWLEYGRWQDDEAYSQAVRDGYFKYIEIERGGYEKNERFAALSATVVNNLDSDYEAVYDQGGFLIYRRKY